MSHTKSSSVFTENLAEQQQQDGFHRFTLELGMILVLVFGSFMVMINDLKYNSLFLDEAINAVVGGDFLTGNFSRNALTFHFGSYLYPVLSAVVNKLGGVTAMRLVSAILMCMASAFIYFTAKRLFGRRAGLVGGMLFAFNGNILNLGQLAVYDVLAIPFMAASLYFLVLAATSSSNQKRLLLTASSFAVLATLSKYIGLIYLPALFLTALALYLLKGATIRDAAIKLSLYFAFPIILVLGGYAAVNWSELTQVFREQGFSPAPQWLIIKIIGQEIGFIMVLALTGLVLLACAVVIGRRQDTQALFGRDGSQVHWQMVPHGYRTLFFILLFLLTCAWLASPLQHLLTANNRSLWKNCAYSLIFLSPLAGYFVSSAIGFFRSHSVFLVRVAGMLIMCLGVYYFIDDAMDANWSFHESWPNTEGAMTYLRESGIDENSRVLAEEMDVYEYYFAPEISDSRVWNNFWNMEHDGLSGQEGALAAISDRALDFVIIDDYYVPGIRERATPVLVEAGYIVGWQETQILRTGDTIWLQVFILGE
jgi:4-amino-4-deoxy-L-arabinose transferase-like glycosyltransferase